MEKVDTISEARKLAQRVIDQRGHCFGIDCDSRKDYIIHCDLICSFDLANSAAIKCSRHRMFGTLEFHTNKQIWENCEE